MNQSISSLTATGDITELPSSRAEARSQGIKRYYTGKPCPKGHMTYRYTAGGGCAECQAVRMKEKYEGGWRQDTTTRKQINARWNVSNKGMAAKQRWRERNPKRAWCVHMLNGIRRRAAAKNVPCTLTVSELVELMPDKCPVFGVEFSFINNGKMTPDSPSVDRLIPSRGYVKDNVAIVSMKANAIKSAFTSDDVLRVAEWMKENGL